MSKKRKKKFRKYIDFDCVFCCEGPKGERITYSLRDILTAWDFEKTKGMQGIIETGDGKGILKDMDRFNMIDGEKLKCICETILKDEREKMRKEIEKELREQLKEEKE